MSDQERERNKSEVEAHKLGTRAGSNRAGEPTDEERDAARSDEGDDVEGHVLTPRAKTRAKQ